MLRGLKTLRAGDTLIVRKLDRLGRSARDLVAILDELRDRGVRFQSLTEAIDTDTPTGCATWQMISVVADLERSLVAERTRAGNKSYILDFVLEPEVCALERSGFPSKAGASGSHHDSLLWRVGSWSMRPSKHARQSSIYVILRFGTVGPFYN
jgi:hypothetical protein